MDGITVGINVGSIDGATDGLVVGDKLGNGVKMKQDTEPGNDVNPPAHLVQCVAY